MMVVASTVAELMAERGLPVAEKDLAAALDEALLARTAPRGVGALSAPARAFLDAHGGIDDSPSGGDPAAEVLAGTAGQFMALVETSLTGEQAAAVLGVDASTVRGRISRHELHALRVGRRNLLPRWQFTTTGALPHLGALLSALPADLHPLEVEAFFTVACPDLVIGDHDTSPRDWLAGGGDPTPVLEQIAALTLSP